MVETKMKLPYSVPSQGNVRIVATEKHYNVKLQVFTFSGEQRTTLKTNEFIILSLPSIISFNSKSTNENSLKKYEVNFAVVCCVVIF